MDTSIALAVDVDGDRVVEQAIEDRGRDHRAAEDLASGSEALSNRKAAHRQGQMQLIDASQWFKPLHKNLGKKNCELSVENIQRISRTSAVAGSRDERELFAPVHHLEARVANAIPCRPSPQGPSSSSFRKAGLRA